MKQFIIIRKKQVWQVKARSVQQVTQALNSLSITFLAVEEITT